MLDVFQFCTGKFKNKTSATQVNPSSFVNQYFVLTPFITILGFTTVLLLLEMRKLSQEKWEESCYFVTSRHLPGHCSCCPALYYYIRSHTALKSACQVGSTEILLHHKHPKHSHQEVRDKSDNSYHPERRNHVTKVSMFLNLYHGVGGGKKKMNEKKSRLKGSTSESEDQVMRFIPHIGKLLKNC